MKNSLRWSVVLLLLGISLTGHLCSAAVKGSGGLTIRENKSSWVLMSPEFEITVEKRAGTIRLNCEIGFDTSGDGARHLVWTPYPHEVGGEASLAAECISPIKVEYTLSADRFGMRIEVPYARDDSSKYEIDVMQPYRKADWTRQIHAEPACPFPIVTENIGSDMQVRYFDDVNDDTPGAIWKIYRPSIYPQMVIERKDRFFMYGYLDVNTYAIFSPNKEGCLPAFMASPNGIKKGETCTFDIFYKAFPKPLNNYGDTFKWYLQHIYSTNPLTKGIVTMPKSLPHKVFYPGGVAFTYTKFATPPEGQDSEFFEKLDDHCVKLRLYNIWGGPDCRIGEQWPNNDTPEAIRAKAEIERLRKMGLRCYLYFRQIYGLQSVFDDRPPYKKWLLRNKKGDLAPYDTTNTTYFGDFCNPDFVKWYVEDVKRTVDYYNPDGVAFDTQWGDVHCVPACSNHPKNGGMHHGMLRIQYEVYQWLHSKHPEMKVIINGAAGNLSQLYCDGILWEGGWRYGGEELSMQVARVFNNSLLAITYPDFFLHTYGPDRYEKTMIETAMLNLANGVTWGSRGFDLFEYNGTSSAYWQSRCPDMIGTAKCFSKMAEFAEFSALTAAVPIVTEKGAVRVSPDDKSISATVWANNSSLLLAAFNNSDKDEQVVITIDRPVLKKYGRKDLELRKFVVLGQDGLPAGRNDFHFDLVANALVVKGTLRGKNLLVAR